MRAPDSPLLPHGPYSHVVTESVDGFLVPGVCVLGQRRDHLCISEMHWMCMERRATDPHGPTRHAATHAQGWSDTRTTHAARRV